MRFLSIIPLLVAYALGQPTGGYYKVDNFSASDSVSIPGVIGSFSGGALGFTRLNADADDFEFVVPTGTGVPVNAHGAVLTGTTTADTLAVSTLLASDTSSFKPLMTADTLMVVDRATFDYATASTPARFDANKRLVSGAYSGTGTTVMTNTAPTVSNLTATGTTTTAGITASGNIALSGAGEGLDLNRSGGAGYVRWMDGSGGQRFVVQRNSTTKQLVFYPQTASGDSGTFRFQASSGNLSTIPALLINTANNRVLVNTPTDNGEQFQVSGSARISGATTLQSTLAVTGASTFTGAVGGSSSNWSGNVRAGSATPNTNIRLDASGTGSLSGVNQIGLRSEVTFGSDATTGIFGSTSRWISPNTSFTTTNAYGHYIVTPSKGASHTVTTNYGLYVQNQGGIGGTNYAIWTGTGAVRFGDAVTSESSVTATRFQSGTGTSNLDTLVLDVLDVGEITGAGLFGDSLTIDSALVLANLSANSPLYLDGNNEVKTGTWSGTGTVVVTNTSPTIATPTFTGATTTAAINASGTVTAAGFVTAGNIQASGLTGTGFRLATLSPSGFLGQNTTISGTYTWAGGQTFQRAVVMDTLSTSGGALIVLDDVDVFGNLSADSIGTAFGLYVGGNLTIDDTVFAEGPTALEGGVLGSVTVADSVTAGMLKGTHRLTQQAMGDESSLVEPETELMNQVVTFTSTRTATLYDPAVYGPGRCIKFVRGQFGGSQWNIDPGAFEINGSTADRVFTLGNSSMEICTAYNSSGVIDNWVISYINN